MKNNKAFSLVEISIVVLIVGLLIFGISKGNNLYNDFKLSSARSLTLGSPVNAIKNVVLWYETSLDASFIAGENKDGADITRWNDISNNSYKNHGYAGQKTNANGISYNLATTSTSANTKGPIYIKDGINGIPTLQFRNTPTGEYRYIVSDINSRNQGNEDLTLIVVAKYISGTGYFVDRQCTYQGLPLASCSMYSGSENTPVGAPMFNIVIESTKQVYPGCRYDDGISCTGISTKQFYNDLMIISFQRKFNSALKFFYNGKQVSSSADNSKSLKIQPLKIGRHANWENTYTDSNSYISEVILITGTITDIELNSIEDYLGKKYSIPVSH